MHHRMYLVSSAATPAHCFHVGMAADVHYGEQHAAIAGLEGSAFNGAECCAGGLTLYWGLRNSFQ